MNTKVWLALILQTLKPMPWSWLLIVGPLVVFLLAVIIARSPARKPPGTKGIWQHMGRQWKGIGIWVLGIACALYIVSAEVSRRSRKDDRDYQQRLETAIRKAARGEQGALTERIRDLAKSLSPESLRDVGLASVGSLEGDARTTFFDVRIGMKGGRKRTYVGPKELFLWPQERIDEFSQRTGLKPAMLDSGLRFDEEQSKEWGGELSPARERELWPKLKSNQWQHFAKQFVVEEDRQLLVNLLVDFFGRPELHAEADALCERMLTVKYPDQRMLSKKLSWVVQSPKSVRVFDFCVRQIWWLREILWFLLYAVLGIWIVVTGRTIVRQGQRRAFLTN
ncbi:MAG: hypothetical protein HN341_18110 [Verrucomicrobia bacterium]|jgi:hypothetical protein|nr:hypothetical protein [Verrucomicrobiota bacterium]